MTKLLTTMPGTEIKSNKNTWKERIRCILDRIKRNTSITVAVLLVVACFGLLDTIVTVIDKALVPITDVKRNVWLDCLFIILTLWCGILVLRSWRKKIIASRTVGVLLVPISLYGYFRFASNSPYSFVAYWNGPFSYVDGFALIGLAIIGLYVYQQCKKAKEEEQNGQFSFDTDAPIKKADKDLFNMGSLVKRIVNYIAFTDVSDTAFSMGIVGEWGDGKTSLMNLVEERIGKEHEDFIVVHFNPRGSKKADYIQEDFLEALKQSLAPLHSGIDRTIDKYAVALDVVPGMPAIVEKGMELLQISSDKQREVKRGDLMAAIEEIGRRIVVMVDDLDRLTGEELIEVLKVLDTNGAFPNMVFLTSFDKGYVNAVLNSYLGLTNQGRAYTDKYFTVEIPVPLHPSFRLMDYLVKLLKDAAKSGFVKMDAASVEGQTRKQMNYIMPRLRTIRDIKRFANQFLYDYAEVQRDVLFRDYLLLELVKYAHPKDYKALYRLQYIHRGKSSFLSPSSDELFYLSDKLVSKKNRAGDGYDEPEIKPDSIDILLNLFPDEESYQNWYAGRYQRIYSVSSFEHYFYNYEYSHLKSEDIDRLFREKSIRDVSVLIDGWADFSKDLETYLLTRDVNSIKSKDVLRRFMQVLLYSAHKHQSINYIGQNYCFLRTKDVESFIKNCGFASKEEYITWFKDSMAELTDIEPMIPANYIRTPIGGMYSEQAEPELFVMTLQEMQEYALSLLVDYLARIGEKGWDVSTAYYMTQIQCDAKGTFLPEACKALHDAMVSHFAVFSSTLPFFAQQVEQVVAGYTVLLRFKAVFEDTEEFERIIGLKENDDAPEIDLVRAIWPIYKANGCQNFALPKGVSEEEARKTRLKSALDDLKRYEAVDKKIEDLAEDWKKGHKPEDVDVYIERAKDLLTELKAIPLELILRETYRIQLMDMISQFQTFAREGSEQRIV